MTKTISEIKKETIELLNEFYNDMETAAIQEEEKEYIRLTEKAENKVWLFFESQLLEIERLKNFKCQCGHEILFKDIELNNEVNEEGEDCYCWEFECVLCKKKIDGYGWGHIEDDDDYFNLCIEILKIL
jgi:DNA-directed RNA polymerase subunit RPC12/RpoP